MSFHKILSTLKVDPGDLAGSSANGKVLKVNGSGALEWADDTAGSVSAVANGADNRIATFSSTDALNGESTLTFDGTTLDVGVTDGGTLTLASTTSSTSAFRLENSSGNFLAQLTSSQNTASSGWVPGLLTASSNLLVGTSSTGDLIFATNDSERIRITSGGSVGIGKTPATPFHIDCGDEYDSGLRIEHDGVTNIDIYTDGGSRSYFKHNQNHIVMENSGYTAFTCADSERMRITSTGSVSIGDTSPTSPSGADRFLKLEG